MRALCEYRGELFAGGEFQNSGATPIRALARWDGASWQPVDPFAPFSGSVSALTIHANELIAGGALSVPASGGTANGVARWNGSNWRMVGPDAALGNSPIVRALASGNGVLYAGGDALRPGNTGTAGFFAVFNGNTWSIPDESPNDDVTTIVAAGEKTHVFGSFVSIGDQIGARAATLRGLPPGCPGDLDGDGAVGSADVSRLMGAWSTAAPSNPAANHADLTSDGVVNSADLARLLALWGPCP